MPTVPGGEEEENGMTSIASQAFSPKIAKGPRKLDWQDFRFPIGQVAQGTYQGKTWRQFKPLEHEIADQQQIESQRAYGEIAKGIGSKIGPGWERMIKQGPKSKNIQVQSGMDLDPTPTEVDFVKEMARSDKKQWLQQTKGQPTPPGLQPSFKGIATDKLGLNEQEQNLYQHHLDNLEKGGVKNKDGSTSTILAITAGFGDKTYVIPTVWDNQVVSQDQAIANARKKGIDKFPSYDSQLEAMSRYQQMHDYMDIDVKQ